MKTETKNSIKGIFIIGIIIFLIWIVSAEFGETHVEFSLATAQPSCQFNAEGDVSYWVWWETNPIPPPDGFLHRDEVGFPISTIPPVKVSCYLEGGWPSWGCCPDDIQCNPPTSPVPVDIRDQCYGFAPKVCSDYNEYSNPEAYCKAFNINTAIRSVEYFTGIPEICSGDYSVPVADGTIFGQTGCNQYTSNCRCYWDSANNECKSTSTNYVFCDSGGNYTGNCTQGGVIKDNQCIEKGLITYIWQAIWNMSGTPTPSQDDIIAAKPTYCNPGTKTFSCNMVKLTVFTFMNVLLCILIVVIIYYYKIVRGRRETTFP